MKRQPEGQERGSPIRGRPRDRDIDARVLASSRELLVEVGYNGLSFEAVARAAGVTRPTLYLRWPTKAHLVYETLFAEPGTALPDTADFASDLRTFIEAMALAFSDPVYRAAFPGLLADFYRNPELEQAVIKERWEALRAAFSARLARAVEQGVIQAPPCSNDLLDFVVGALYQRIIVLQESTEGYIDALVEIVMRALTPPVPQRRGR